ncbi:MAG: prolipoprotein diacylglyceryl transferase [Bacteroides sp.]|nr:prolipoprotein diacylglyceryl transferase [Bacteroides sp.]MCM1447934.1 prolipoprotein diacylglyceryl transferase [Bacteroides sp.]
MSNFLYILWSPDVVAFHLGPMEIRWYSLCWAIGMLAVYKLMHHLYMEQKISEEKFEPMLVYCFLGIFIGARLGHCLFYEPEYFLSHPAEMILPMRKLSDGQWHFTGYEGLASHGGTIGLMLALWLYCRKTRLNIMHVLDNVAIVTPVCAFAIRIGNLMNSEIIGHPTDVPWAFVFTRVDMLPRHPGQLYEALCYAFFFCMGWGIYRMSMRPEVKKAYTGKGKKPLLDIRVGSGFYFGLCIFLIFLSRIFIEFTKENQVAFEASMTFNMGQLLSVPFVLLGLYCIFGGKLCRKLGEY